MKKIMILAICLMFVLTACKQPNVPPKNGSNNKDSNSTISNEQNADISSPIVNNDTVYIEIDSNASAEYKAAITAYNKFLSGEITAKNSDGTSYNVLQYGTGNGISNFALGDVNNDNVPELFIHESHYAVLGFDGNNLTEWYDSMGWQSISLLENCAILDTHSSVGVTYNYITFKADGIDKSVRFSKPAENEPNQTFYFESEEISKEEWEARTKPYFEQAEKKVELKWIKWEKKDNPTIAFDSVAEPYRSILENKQTFYSAAKKENVKISSYNRDIWQYASVDFDSDGVDEFAIMLQDGDIVILRKNGDLIFGFNFGLHSMYRINKDGTYLWNANTGKTYGCSKLEFSQNDCKSVELFRVEQGENDLITYYVGGKVATENEFKAAQAKINTQSIAWTSLN